MILVAVTFCSRTVGHKNALDSQRLYRSTTGRWHSDAASRFPKELGRES
jgi:hypothetical protein